MVVIQFLIIKESQAQVGWPSDVTAECHNILSGCWVMLPYPPALVVPLHLWVKALPCWLSPRTLLTAKSSLESL